MRKHFVIWVIIIIMLMQIMPAHAKAEDSIKLGDYVQMGTYYDEPILWRCVSFEKISGYDSNGNPIIDSTDTVTEYKDGYLPLMLSDKIICVKAFDAMTSANSTTGSHSRDMGVSRQRRGSNCWSDSNIRSWLNSKSSAGNVTWLCGNPPSKSFVGSNAYDSEAGFLSNFSQNDISSIKSVTHKSIVAREEYDEGIYTSGISPAGTFSIKNYRGEYINSESDNEYFLRVYNDACSEMVDDTMFLLDVLQVKNILDNEGILGVDYHIGKLTASAVENAEFTNEEPYIDIDGVETYHAIDNANGELIAGDKHNYWLRTPSYYGELSYAAVYAGNIDFGYTFINYAYNGDTGVRPAFYLNLPSFSIQSGNGSASAPYIGYGSGGGTSSTAAPISTNRSVTIDSSVPDSIVYNSDTGKYTCDSFPLVSNITNWINVSDDNNADISAKDVKIDIELPEGFSFSAGSSVRTKEYSFSVISLYESITDTVYLKNPTVGEHTITAHISGSNVEAADFSCKVNIGNYVFNEDIYRAEYLIDKAHGENSSLGTVMEQDFTGETPSSIQRETGREKGLERSATAWEMLTDACDTASNPSTAIDLAFEEKDVYSAIIMNIFESSVDYKAMGYINNDITKQTKNLISTVTSDMKNKYSYDMLNKVKFKSLSEKEKKEVSDAIGVCFNIEHTKAADIAKITSFVGDAINYASDFQSLCENIATYYNITKLSDSMKQVITDMYNKCPKDNLALKDALWECRQIMNAGDAEFAAKMTAGVVGLTGKNIAKAGLDAFWSDVKTSAEMANPALLILEMSYAGSKYITQVLFNADAITEKYFDIVALVNTEDVLRAVYNDAKRNFSLTRNEGNAKVYNSAVDIMFNMLDTDCDYAKALADAVENSLTSVIARALGDTTTEDFKKSVKNIQNGYADRHEQVLTWWIDQLEAEGSPRYKEYDHLINESKERTKKRYEINCPVDVYVYDSNGVLAGSVIDNKAQYRDGANITLAVSGDEKTLYVHDDEEYKIVYKGNDTGVMDIIVTEFDENEAEDRKVYFNNITLTADTVYNSADTGDGTYAIVDDMQMTIPADYDTNTEAPAYTAEIENGYFTNDVGFSKELHKGENVGITAYVPEGYKFVGWTSDAGEGIFEDADSISTAVCMPDYNIHISAALKKAPAIEKLDTKGNNITVITSDCENLDNGKVILAYYDHTGRLKGVSIKDFQSTVSFTQLSFDGSITIKAMIWEGKDSMQPAVKPQGTVYYKLWEPSVPGRITVADTNN